MKAGFQDVYGPPEVLRLEEIDQPVPGRGEVLLRAPRRRVRGMDAAGRVEALGADVTRFRRGDEVYGTCAGAFAEYARAKEDQLAPRPGRLTPEQAAVVAVSAGTALQALRAGRLRQGQRVLAIGAGGGIGRYAVQPAKARRLREGRVHGKIAIRVQPLPATTGAPPGRR
ncbi:hypothetical protein AB0M92_11330 [Streptomyces sp. NPDC051582]|uniref:alcohol dehydrogenase catalytic domain-containing protein n=1 Tax=Streptomyces sp. NPDC051582 TaxID=3155167 RepID=UPI0034472791